MAHNKVKELRSVLQDNEHMWTVFLEQLRNTGASLPNVAGWDAFTDKLWLKSTATCAHRIRMPLN